jgi:hypothetical protein
VLLESIILGRLLIGKIKGPLRSKAGLFTAVRHILDPSEQSNLQERQEADLSDDCWRTSEKMLTFLLTVYNVFKVKPKNSEMRETRNQEKGT